MPKRKAPRLHKVFELALRDNKKATTNLLPDGALQVGFRDDNKQPVGLLRQSMPYHTHVVGFSGVGKTNFLKYLVQQLVERKRQDGYGFAIIDPHGGLAGYALDFLAVFAPDLAKDVYYLDLKKRDSILAFNPLWRWVDHHDATATGDDPAFFIGSCWMEACTKLYGVRDSKQNPSIANVMANLGQALVTLGLSPVHARYFLHRGFEEKKVLRHLIQQLPVGDLRSYWNNFDQKTKADISAETKGPDNRLLHLTRPETFRLMMGQTEISLDFLRLMNQGGIGVFNLAIDGTSITPDGQNLFASMLLQQFRQTFQFRKPDDPKTSPPFTLLLDEFGDYCSPEFARAFTAARKFNLEVVFAHQELSQLVPESQDKKLLNAVLAVPNKMIFGGLPLDQCQLLTEQVWLAMIDPDRIKHQPETVTWDPIPVKDIVKGRTLGDTDTRAEGGSSGTSSISSEGETEGEGTGSGMAFHPETGDKLRASEQSSSQRGRSRGSASAYSDSSTWAFTSSRSWSESEQEVWRTEYRQRIQKGAPIYESIEEQVFRYAQAMKLRPKGRFVFAQIADVPYYSHVPLVEDIELSDEQRTEFLEGQVFKKQEYLPRAKARLLLEEKERELLSDAGDVEDVVLDE